MARDRQHTAGFLSIERFSSVARWDVLHPAHENVQAVEAASAEDQGGDRLPPVACSTPSAKDPEMAARVSSRSRMIRTTA